MKNQFAPKSWKDGLDPNRVTAINDYLKGYWEEVNGKREAINTTLPETIPPLETKTFECERCHDLGMFTRDVPLDDPLFGKMLPCPDCAKGAQMEREQWRRRYRTSELPRQFQGFTFASWNDMLQDSDWEGKRPAYQSALHFAQTDGHWVDLYQIFQDLGMPWEEGRDYRAKNALVFWGEMGTGKSGLMSAIINELLGRGVTCLYSRLDEFIEDYRSTYKEDSERTTEEVISKYKKVPLLCWDEMNIYGVKDDVLNRVEAVIRYRYHNELPLIMTTNLSQEAFAEMFKGRSADAAIAMAHWIHVGGLKLRRTDPSVYDWQRRKDLR